jgi:hypothetical protein
MSFGKIDVTPTVDELVSRLRELNVFETVKSLPKSGRKLFLDLLQFNPFDSPQRSVLRSARIAGELTLICEFRWSDDLILSALVAAQRQCLLPVTHLDNLSTCIA